MTPTVATFVWLAVYGTSALLFFGVAVWVVIRGGRDLIDLFAGRR